MNMTQELKPCPFCGTKQEQKGGMFKSLILPVSNSLGSHYVTCYMCEATGAIVEKDENTTPEQARQKAIESWNTRPTEDRLTAENKALREALERIRDCNFVVSLPDRMDAVRDIANEALNHTKGE